MFIQFYAIDDNSMMIMNMKPRKKYIIIFMKLPYLYKNKMIPQPNHQFSKNILHLERANIINSNQGSPKFQEILVAYGTIHETF